MSETTVEMTGDMAPQELPTKSGFASVFRIPTSVPDPKEWLAHQRANVRPWLIFLQTANFSTPSLTRVSRRIMRNIEYFQSNYVFVFLGLVVYCLITSPLLLIAVGGSLYAGYRLSKRHQEGEAFKICGRVLTLAQQYGVVSAISMCVFYLVGAHSVIFWLIGASFTLITLHAAFYNIDALLSSSEDQFGLLQEV